MSTPWKNAIFCFGRNAHGAKVARLKWEEAVDEHRIVLTIDEEDFQAHYNLGRTYSALNRFPDAIASFKEAVRLDSEDGRAHFELARAYHAIKEKKEVN